MARIAYVGYGHDGRGLGKTEGSDPQGYAYLVNDNVRAGQMLQVSVKHADSGKIFGTTGLTLSTVKEDSVKGNEISQKMQSEGKYVAHAYTGKEAGISRAIGAGKGELKGSYSTTGGINMKQVRENRIEGLQDTQKMEINPYIQKVRTANVESRKMEQKYANYDSYYNSFKGEQ